MNRPLAVLSVHLTMASDSNSAGTVLFDGMRWPLTRISVSHRGQRRSRTNQRSSHSDPSSPASERTDTAWTQARTVNPRGVPATRIAQASTKNEAAGLRCIKGSGPRGCIPIRIRLDAAELGCARGSNRNAFGCPLNSPHVEPSGSRGRVRCAVARRRSAVG